VSNLFDKSIIFDEIMRQKGDDQKDYREILDSISNGTFTKEQWKKLKKRELYGNGDISKEESDQFMAEGILICAYNKDLVKFNKQKIEGLGTPIAKIKSENSSACVAKLDASSCKGLMTQLWVAKNEKMILTTNLWKAAGLTNGAKCYVKYIIYEGKTKPPALPTMVIVEVPQYIGPGYKGMEKCVPIFPVKRDWYHSKRNVWRRMLPLKPGYAQNIHTSQGVTISDKYILNIGNTEYAAGLTYTGISRGTKYQNLSFKPMYDYKRFKQIFNKAAFKDRMKQEERERESERRFLQEHG
jgi:hypothetical protein